MRKSNKPLLEAALNGARSRDEHAAIPRTPSELATEGATAVEAGADVLHVHAFDDDGVETLEGRVCGATLSAIRATCPTVPISLTTSSTIEPDPTYRFQMVSGWSQLPDLVTANQGERGIDELCEYLVHRGVGIEAGLLCVDDADRFVRSGLADKCVRVLVEPLDHDPHDACLHAAAMEEILTQSEVTLEQIHHGDGIASWAVSMRGLDRGHGIRTGLEDTTFLPDGTPAADNASLVRAAVATMKRSRAS